MRGRASIFEYMYRDGGNFKTYGRLLLARWNAGADAKVERCLAWGGQFVAARVGDPVRPPPRFRCICCIDGLDQRAEAPFAPRRPAAARRCIESLYRLSRCRLPEDKPSMEATTSLAWRGHAEEGLPVLSLTTRRCVPCSTRIAPVTIPQSSSRKRGSSVLGLVRKAWVRRDSRFRGNGVLWANWPQASPARAFPHAEGCSNSTMSTPSA